MKKMIAITLLFGLNAFAHQGASTPEEAFTNYVQETTARPIEAFCNMIDAESAYCEVQHIMGDVTSGRVNKSLGLWFVDELSVSRSEMPQD